jgi:hypothetical protein
MRVAALLLSATVVAGPLQAAQDASPYAFTLTGTAFDERCVTLGAGDELRYRFRASAPVDFNIHHHRGKDVFYPVRQTGVRDAEGRFRAAGADDYCLMWEHRGAGSAMVEGSFERVPAR